MTEQNDQREQTAVDDVRRVRERLDREAGGDVHRLAEQTREQITEEYLLRLGLRIASPSDRQPHATGSSNA